MLGRNAWTTFEMEVKTSPAFYPDDLTVGWIPVAGGWGERRLPLFRRARLWSSLAEESGFLDV